MRYKLITQKPFCCVPASVQMVLERRKLKYLSQDTIGWDLGLVVPSGNKKFFKKVRTGKPYTFGYGTNISKFSLNMFFRKNGYHLKMVYLRANKIKDLKKIVELYKKGHDILVCFRNDVLFGLGKYGHVCPIENIGNKNITVADPAKAKFRKIKISKLIKAMNSHLKTKNSMAGIWIIK